METIIIFTLLSILLFAFLDRLIGWGGFGRTKPVILGAGLIIALFHFGGVSSNPLLLQGAPEWLIAYFAPFLIAVAFFIWRTIAWKTLGGSLNPEVSEAPGTFARHSLAFVFVPVGLVAGVSLFPLAGAILGFVIAATLLGRANNIYGSDRGKDINEWIEIARGAFLGLALAIGFIW